jgi:Flp pilus assembly protein TadG
MTNSLRPSKRPRAGWGGWRSDRRGSAFVEFGLLAPIYLLVIGGVIDIGRAISMEFNLSNGVSAAANFALNQAVSAPLTSSNAQTWANNLANIVASSYSTGWANATVVVNNSITATITNGGAISTTGSTTNANSFYCPTGSVKVGITWGSSYTSAGQSCSTGGPLSGKYIVLSATKSFTALILPASIMSNSFTVSAVVQVQ